MASGPKRQEAPAAMFLLEYFDVGERLVEEGRGWWVWPGRTHKSGYVWWWWWVEVTRRDKIVVLFLGRT